MKLNVGTWDRMLRVVAGVALAILLATGTLNIGTSSLQ